MVRQYISGRFNSLHSLSDKTLAWSRQDAWNYPARSENRRWWGLPHFLRGIKSLATT